MPRAALFACSIGDVSEGALGPWAPKRLGFCNDAELASDLRVPCYACNYYLTAVHCGTELMRLATMGDGWLQHCAGLAVLDCSGLTQLATVGHDWLFRCTSLTTLDCSGLGQLTRVGKCWLRQCTSLTALDCSGLVQLATVGDCWLDRCTNLTTLDCSGLGQLTRVGHSWLRDCSGLTAVARVSHDLLQSVTGGFVNAPV